MTAHGKTSTHRFDRQSWTALLALGAAALTFLRADGADASCVAQPPRLVWSYPPDGAVDVPTNARLFYLTALSGRRSTLEVNGKAPPADPPGDGPPYGRGLALEPRTRYTVTIKVEGYGSEPESTLSWTFTTGDGPAPASLPRTLAINRITALPERELSPVCEQAWQAMDCFDTGQDTHVVFETDARPVMFFVLPLGSGSSVPWTIGWPGVCGSPEVYVREASGCRGPHRIFAVAHTGEAVTTDVECNAQPPGTPWSPATGDAHGCAIGARTSGSSPIATVPLALACAWILARRRRRPRRS